MNLNIKKRQSISETAYIVFFCLLFFAKGIGLYDGQKWFLIFLVPAVICYALKLVLTDWDAVSAIMTVILLALAVVSWRRSGDKSVMAAVMMITGMKGVRLQKLWNNALPVWTAAFWGAIVLSLLGLWPTVRLMHHKGSLFILRNSLGMTHPNVLFISYIIFISLLFLVYRWEGKKAIVPLIFTAAGGAFIFLYAFSYTGLMCLVVFVILLIYFCFRGKRTRLENILLVCALPLCVAVSLGIPLVMGSDGPFYDFLYKVFNTRFYMTQMYLKYHAPSLFGQHFDMDGTWSVDCSYTYGYLAFGMVLLILILVGWSVMIAHMVKKDMNIELAIVLSLCVAGIMEPFMFNFSFKNLMYPMLGAYVFMLISLHNKKKQMQIINTEQSDMKADSEDVPVEMREDDLKNTELWYTRLWEKVSEVFIAHRSRVLCFTLAGLILGAIASAALVHYPSNIIISRDMSDYIDLKENYEVYGELDSGIIEDAWIIGIDTASADVAEAKCYVFSGQPVNYVTTRARVTLALACGCLGLVLGLALEFVLELAGAGTSKQIRKKDEK